MNFYIILFGEFVKNFATTVRDIIDFFNPFLIPLGTFLASVMDAIAGILPYGNLLIYIILFIAFLILGIIINTKWPGEEKKEIVKERKKLYSMGYSLDDTLEDRKEEDFDETLEDQKEE